jgi:hypothetical protein
MSKQICFFVLLLTLLFSCKDEQENHSQFFLQGMYDTIRSCPGGGGVFIIRLLEPDNRVGQVSLSLEAPASLNASLSPSELSLESPVAEVTINLEVNISIEDYEIKINATNSVSDTSISLYVMMYNWPTDVGEDLLLKKKEFDVWLHNEFPELNIDTATEWISFPTYPEILIVEHVTFLNDTYEYRIQRHAMILPTIGREYDKKKS